MKTRGLRTPASINAILLLSIFTFVFLGVEYLYVNMMSRMVGEDQTVIAQNYALGISVLGFILYPVLNRAVHERFKALLTFSTVLVSIICIFLIQQHISYAITLTAGLILFFLMGLFGSSAHYLAVCTIHGERTLARLVGFAYAGGILLQYINNNLINIEIAEAVILSVFLAVLSVLFIRTRHVFRVELMGEEKTLSKALEKTNGPIQKKITTGLLLVFLVALMACVFSTLDNAITLGHAAGAMDIGQWPRILLALSGLAAGFLFDIRNRKYMTLMMYCVMVFSVLCVIILRWGGPFLTGVVIAYIASGFFVVFFTTSFLEFAACMRIPALWAGMGRAVNNLVAALVTNSSVTLLLSGRNLTLVIFMLVLFVAVSILMFAYTTRSHTALAPPEAPATGYTPTEKFSSFASLFSLTDREQDVLQYLLVSDSSVQDIAQQMAISRPVLYRHISSLNEKTGTKSRIGLLQFYYEWIPEKEDAALEKSPDFRA